MRGIVSWRYVKNYQNKRQQTGSNTLSAAYMFWADGLDSVLGMVVSI